MVGSKVWYSKEQGLFSALDNIHIGTNAIQVPRSLGTVTTIEASQEVDPGSVGMSQKGVNAIWRTVEDLYKTGMHPGISLCVRRRGEIVINRALGHARGNGPKDNVSVEPVLMKPDTPVCLFSASKAVTALLIHILCEEGKINLQDPVSFYAPEFGQNGKKNITVHHVLSHRSGVPGMPGGVPPETIWNNDEIWRLLCEAKPLSSKGDKLAYHALTGGYILERVVQAATGDSIQAYLDEKIRKPMGMKYFQYGVAPECMDVAADNYVTGFKPVFPVSTLIKRVLGGPVDKIQGVVNDPRFRQSIIPAGNIYGTAEESGRFFQMLLNNGQWNGVQICDPMTVRRFTHEYASMQLDYTVLMPMRYSAGLMLGGNPVGVWGRNSAKSYGHIGLANKMCWSDPVRNLSVSLLNTGIPFVGTVFPPLINFMAKIDKHCSRDGN